MGSGQMMMSIWGLLLFMKLALSGNSLMMDDGTMARQSEAIVTATSIAQEIIERITVKGYDQTYPGGTDTVKNSQLSAYPFVRDAGETTGRDTTFNDVDDYDAFTDSIATPRFGKFYVSCAVHYIAETAPYANTSSKTRMKHVDISVTNPVMVDTHDPLKLQAPVTLSKIVVYR